MPNTYFRFKEFTVHQDDCAMKVCTDSCLFGAWAARRLLEKRYVHNILDIGTGTGLLGLMLAQKLAASFIDCVEIESACSKQAERNILQSPWCNRMQIHTADINQFVTQKKYDFIISNPPFYESDLKSKSDDKNIAHHNSGLTLSLFIRTLKKQIADTGCFAVLLPCFRMQAFEKIANDEGFFVNQKTFVRQTYGHSFFRTMAFFSKEKNEMHEDDMSIKKQDNRYSDEFVSLLRDYYLHL